MRRSEQMGEDKPWSPREERPKPSPGLLDDEDDEDGPGAAGGSETEACLGDGAAGFGREVGVEDGEALPVYMSMHR